MESDVTALTGSRWLGAATLQPTVSIQLLLGNSAHNTQSAGPLGGGRKDHGQYCRTATIYLEAGNPVGGHSRGGWWAVSRILHQPEDFQRIVA